MRTKSAVTVSVVMFVCMLFIGAASAQSPGKAGRRCDALKPFAAGDTVKADADFVINGTQRSATYYFPPSFDGNSGFTLVFMLPGTFGAADDFLSQTDMRRKADTNKYILVAVEGYDRRWNTPPVSTKPDDMAFIQKVKDWTLKNVCVDPRRVFMLGFSGGARTASRAVCELSGFAGLAASSGIRHDSSCPGSGTSIPVIAIHGDADSMNSYDGGLMPRWSDSVETAIGKWVTSNGCDSTHTSTMPYPGVERRSYATNCANNAHVVLYKVKGGGHLYDIAEMDESQQYVDFFNAH